MATDQLQRDGISRVVFSVMSAADIRSRAACEVQTVDMYSNGAPVANGIYDPRMGATEHGHRCATCKHTNKECPGHPGFIELALPVLNPLFIDYVKKTLRAVCLECSAACLPDSFNAGDLGDAVLSRAAIESKKVRSCPFCDAQRPDQVQWSPQNVSCFSAAWKGVGGPEQTLLRSHEVFRILERVSDDDCARIGLNPARTRPESLLFKALPVIPIAARLPHRSSGQRRDDDVTVKYSDILKRNRLLLNRIEAGEDTMAAVNSLQLDVIQLIENSGTARNPVARLRSTMKPLKSLSSRLRGKEGRVRNNLLGKRVDFSARSVITPEPNISIDEVGVPVKIAMILTFPEVVHAGNLDRLTVAVRNGPAAYPGALTVRRGETLQCLERADVRRRTELVAGDVVERHMIDGDNVLFNRQPSLHRMSMMTFRTKIMPHETFRLNVLVTTPFNADFDGDECNLHLPQSASTNVEISRLGSVKTQIVSPRHHEPIIGVVQDVALGIFELTQDGVEVPLNASANICAHTGAPLPTASMSGKDLFSAILPPRLHCDAGSAVIRNGRLIAGTVGKADFQKPSTGVLHTTLGEYGCDEAVALLNRSQDTVCDWLTTRGFSMGAADLLVPPNVRSECENIAARSIRTVDDFIAGVHRGDFSSVSDGTGRLERLVTSELDNAHARIIGIIERESSARRTRLHSMVASKSKGNKKNMVQMMGMLGQNYIEGGRIPCSLGDRALPHFKRFEDGAAARGFVASSFLDGLEPHEFFFHAMAGREGLIDTAVRTAETGYIQRKLIKALEDLRVATDGSVRAASGNIISFKYGGDGMDACAIEYQDVPSFAGGINALACSFMCGDNDDAEFERTLTPDAFRAWKGRTPEVSARLADHFRRIVHDKNYIARVTDVDGCNLGKGVVAHAIAFDRILTRCTLESNPAAAGSDLDFAAALDLQGDLAHDLFPEAKGAISVGAALIRSFLSPKQLVRRGATTNALLRSVAIIRQRYYSSLVSPSEMVGILAAQSIAEPSTQMVLNTFHSAGMGTNRASVPRVKELISASRNPKRTMYGVTLLRGTDTDRAFAEYVRGKMLCTHVSDVVYRSQMVCERGSFSSETDARITRAYEAMRPGVAERNDDAPRFVLRIEFDRAKLLAHNVSMLDVHAALNGRINASVIVSDDASARLIARVLPDTERFSDGDFIVELRHLEKFILNLRIKGVAGIHTCDVLHETLLDGDTYSSAVYDEECCDYVGKDYFHLRAEGGERTSRDDIVAISLIPGVDPARVTSDNLGNVTDHFGIEAARCLLLRELQGAYSGDNYVDRRHIELLADFITHRGELVPITRHGIGAIDIGPVAKCSFEQTVQKVAHAGVFGEVDDVTGVSANIMLGQTIPCGTGSSSILWDIGRRSCAPSGPIVPLRSATFDRANAFDPAPLMQHDVWAETPTMVPWIPWP
jgi:DNA-directed RNA polymerase II subunit RPB1